MKMTKNALAIRISSALLLSSALVLSLNQIPAKSQSEVAQKAQELCLADAKSKGFELKEIIYAGAADFKGKDAKVVLNLMRGGQLFKLTCYYDKASGKVALGDTPIGNAVESLMPGKAGKAANPVSFPWWLLLLPLIGLPLLLAWAHKRDLALGLLGTSYGQQYDADIRGNEGEPINIYSSPTSNSDIIGTVVNGQRVKITDRDIATETDNWIELALGGWLPKKYVGTPARSC
jgi:hypothetical protein